MGRRRELREERERKSAQIMRMLQLEPHRPLASPCVDSTGRLPVVVMSVMGCVLCLNLSLPSPQYVYLHLGRLTAPPAPLNSEPLSLHHRRTDQTALNSSKHSSCKRPFNAVRSRPRPLPLGFCPISRATPPHCPSQLRYRASMAIPGLYTSRRDILWQRPARAQYKQSRQAGSEQ